MKPIVHVHVKHYNCFVKVIKETSALWLSLIMEWKSKQIMTGLTVMIFSCLSLSSCNYIHIFLCVHQVVMYEHNEMTSQLIILSKVIIKFARVGVYIVQNPWYYKCTVKIQCVYIHVYITVYISTSTPFMNFDYNVNFNN